MRTASLPKRSDSRRSWKTILGFGGDKQGKPSKYGLYLFVISILLMSLSILLLLNAYFHFIRVPSYNLNRKGVSSPYLLAGYLGMFVSIAFLLPDYFLVPACGYLSSIGIFNPYYTFLVCLLGALFPIEYVCGRLAARPVLLKVMSLLHISEKNLETADKWLVEHGKFSIFIATFIPFFFYGAISVAAGTMKMKAAAFLLASFAGYALKYVFLEAVGYYGIYIFTATFDYSQKILFFLLLILSSVYVALYLVMTLARWHVTRARAKSQRKT